MKPIIIKLKERSGEPKGRLVPLVPFNLPPGCDDPDVDHELAGISFAGHEEEYYRWLNSRQED